MLITELRANASRLDRKLREDARKPWNESLQLQLVDFIGALNRFIGDMNDEEHKKFFFEVVRKDELRHFVPANPRPGDVWRIIERLCKEVQYLAIEGKRTSDRHALTMAFCKALKAAGHPRHRSKHR